MGRKYSSFWRKGRGKSAVFLLGGVIPSLISRVLPKQRDLSIFGSFNGALAGDNSLALYLQFKAEGQNAIFITKDRALSRVPFRDGSFPVFAFGPQGIWSQLTASRAYYSHAIFDFVSALVIGSHIVCLQHGFPIKRGGSALKTGPPVSLAGKILKRSGFPVSRVRRILNTHVFPYAYYYYCNEVWSPPGVFAENTSKVFRVGAPRIVVATPPRLAPVVIRPEPGLVLFAPTHMAGLHVAQRIEKWGFGRGDVSALALLQDYGLRLHFRPHPIDVEEVELLDFNPLISIDLAPDVHERLGSYEAVITDVSSLGFDAIFLGIPVRFLLDELTIFQSGAVGIFDSVLPEVVSRGSQTLPGAVKELATLLGWISATNGS